MKVKHEIYPLGINSQLIAKELGSILDSEYGNVNASSSNTNTSGGGNPSTGNTNTISFVIVDRVSIEII